MKPTTEQIIASRGKCPFCDGDGSINVDYDMICKSCHGFCMWCGPLGNLTHTKCAKCGAIDNQITSHECNDCNGTGNGTFETSEVVEVPEVPDGYQFEKIVNGEAMWFTTPTPDRKDFRTIHHFVSYPIGHVETWTCGECGGTGEYKREYIGDTSRGWNVPCRDCKGKGTLSAEVVGVRVETKTRPVTSVVFGKITKIIYTWREV